MSESLAIYLRDHLAGAAHAIELVSHLAEEHADEPLGQFAAELLREIKADRETLLQLAATLGISESATKNVGAWVSEKVSRVKFSQGADGFGTFEALEFLGLGIRGKRSLWRSLEKSAQSDKRLVYMDFSGLIQRAEDQESQVELQRLEIVSIALSPRAAYV